MTLAQGDEVDESAHRGRNPNSDFEIRNAAGWHCLPATAGSENLSSSGILVPAAHCWTSQQWHRHLRPSKAAVECNWTLEFLGKSWDGTPKPAAGTDRFPSRAIRMPAGIFQGK